MPYFMVNIFVVICGIFVIYNILHISVEQNKKLYERLKSLGMVPRQILYLPLFQCLVLCLVSIPVGWLLGVGIVVLAAPVIIVGMGDASAASRHQRYNPDGKSITSRMAELLREHPAVTEYGIIKTMEVPMTADEIQRAPIVETFEHKDETGASRKEYMAGSLPFLHPCRHI